MEKLNEKELTLFKKMVAQYWIEHNMNHEGNLKEVDISNSLVTKIFNNNNLKTNNHL